LRVLPGSFSGFNGLPFTRFCGINEAHGFAWITANRAIPVELFSSDSREAKEGRSCCGDSCLRFCFFW